MAKRFPPKTVSLPKGGDRQAFLDAAYLMIERCWVRLDEKNRRLLAVLTPKSSSKNLSEDFFRWYEFCRANKSSVAARAAELSRALELAEHVDARRREPPPSLPPERLDEIARILKEAESKPRDPHLRSNWEDIR